MGRTKQTARKYYSGLHPRKNLAISSARSSKAIKRRATVPIPASKFQEDPSDSSSELSTEDEIFETEEDDSQLTQIEQLLEHQTESGYFPLNSAYAKVLKSTKTKLISASTKLTLDGEAFATGVGVAYIEKELKSKTDPIIPYKTKAIDWIKAKFPKDLDKIIKAGNAFVSK